MRPVLREPSMYSLIDYYRVQSSLGQGGPRQEIDGAVIGAMRRKGCRFSLIEHLLEISVAAGHVRKVGEV